jgi:hypothetical protein
MNSTLSIVSIGGARERPQPVNRLTVDCLLSEATASSHAPGPTSDGCLITPQYAAPDNREAPFSGGDIMLESQIETFAATPHPNPGSSRAAQNRRNAMARRKLESLRDRLLLRAALADVWDKTVGV